MSNVEHVIETLILGMRDGQDPLDIVKEVGVQNNLHMMGDIILDEDEAVRIACYIVHNLYDGKFPIDHLSVGDICMDAFGCNPCIITNINERTIHVLYFNGKAHKFRKSQEEQFKKLNRNVLLYLNKLFEIANNKAESSLRSLDQERLGYDFPIATSEEDAK
jgi:hypothetical protein